MKSNLGILTLFLTFTTFVFGQKNEENLVRTSFENYKSAILNDKGSQAVNYVDSRTIKYYNDILELTKNADSTKIESLSIMDKLMVFSIKHRTPKEQILSFDGKSLLAYAINNGMVGKNGVTGVSIGDITIDGTFAKGQYVKNEEKASFYFHFYKEDNQWKVDLTSLFPIGNMAFQQMADESGLGTDEFLFSLLEMLTGTKPTKEIWLPIK